jgi:Flp pilus assembly protein TadG
VFKRIMVIALAVAIVAIPINDFGRYLNAYYNLDNVSRDAASAAAGQAHRLGNRDATAAVAVRYAQSRGVTIKFYDQTLERITLTTTTSVPGTWVWGPFVAATKGAPFQQWWNIPLTIESKAQSLIM